MKKKQKVGLVAVSNHNYGSQLQTYAMHYALKGLGVDNEIINYRQTKVKQMKRLLNPSFFSMKCKFFVRDFLCTIRFPEINRGLKIRSSVFEEFIKNNYIFSRQISERKELEQYSKYFDAFFLGSDQVWHPANLEMDFFTLSFVPDSIPKIAYAPSFGVSDIPLKQYTMTKEYLERIDEISVREESGAQIINKLIGRDVPVVCDPTALLTVEQWDALRVNKKYTEEKYIFCYFLGNNMKFREFAIKIRELTGYKILALQHLDEFVKEDMDFGDICPFDVDPANFVDLIADAEIVITDSFHATMFSIYYHKMFYTFSRFSENKKGSTNSRIEGILRRLGLQERHLNENAEVKNCVSSNIDWNEVDEKLSAFRAESVSFLKSAIDKYHLIERPDEFNNVGSKYIDTCTGCMACMHICPKKCITVEEDVEGFWYPSINAKECINCGICKQTCPVDNKYELKTGKAYVARNINSSVRLSSSSGGVFATLAKEIIEKGGVVVGAAFDEQMRVSHRCIEKIDELKALQTSKYVQSDLRMVYLEIKKALSDDRFVLFCGTPCQASGLKHYLKKEYDKLIIADVMCYGVPSPGIFEKYKQFLENKHKSTLKEFYFRDKTFGFSAPNVKAVFENGEIEQLTSDVKSFTKTFFRGVTIRPSCYSCKFKGVEKEVDVTLGDFWLVGEVNKEMDDETGATLVFIHSIKMMKFFQELKELELQEIPIEDAIKYAGPMLVKSPNPHRCRKDFFANMDRMGYIKCVNHYVPDSLLNYFANIGKKIIYVTGFSKPKVLKKIKKWKISKESK